ncbi:LuxR family transcriptional regulator [Rhizobium chutanense]|uniref:LuxR family transcriptional regulator n=2 Tax=Rhizobium chutanense TaxID=2035448 RepID=A0A2A6J2A6_9HYPH|nr:LuxR family transcriptional regulator [Rhizobium chutanense]
MKDRMLSPLEKTCLRWISRGRTIAEIALLEGKTVTEIEGYLQRALATLKAGSTEEALDKANLLEPE